jgi:hypothetical protein
MALMRELGWRIGDALHTRVENIQRTIVDCGTCPVSLECIVGRSGNGWRFDCCGAAALEVPVDDGGRVLLIVDCAANRFAQRERAPDFNVCPLCSGDIVKSNLNDIGDHHRYLPTVHAKHQPGVRLALWRKTIPAALDLKKRIAERNKKK